MRAYPFWKWVVAPIFDFVVVFVVAGLAIGSLTGQTNAHGFDLKGWSATALCGVIIVYFVIGRRFAGGTVGDRILGPGSAAQNRIRRGLRRPLSGQGG